MKKMFSLVLFTSLFIYSTFSQDFKVPKDYKMKKKADYVKYEKDIVEAVNWLEKTPIVEQENKRKEVATFLIVWATGTSSVTMTLNDYLTPLFEKNADVLIMFMGGWSRYVIQNPDMKKDQLAGNLAGIRTVLNVYHNNNGYQKDENLDELVEKDKKGELEAWIKEKIASK